MDSVGWGCTEPVVLTTLGTTCRRCQAKLEILLELPIWPLVSQQDEKWLYCRGLHFNFKILKNMGMLDSCRNKKLNTCKNNCDNNNFDNPLISHRTDGDWHVWIFEYPPCAQINLLISFLHSVSGAALYISIVKALNILSYLFDQCPLRQTVVFERLSILKKRIQPRN